MLGLSRNQRIILNALQATWNNQRHYYHVPRDRNGNTFAGLFPTSSSSSSSIPILSSTPVTSPPGIAAAHKYENDDDRTPLPVSEYNLFHLTPIKRISTVKEESSDEYDAATAAHYHHHVMTLDHTAAYLNAKMTGQIVDMMLSVEVTDMLCEVDPMNKQYVRPNGKIYVRLKKALYGCV